MTAPYIDPATEQALHRFLDEVARQYDMTGAILYGSRARGDHRPDSDADVAYDVLLDTGINITPLPIWRDEWEHPEQFSNPALLGNIAREGIRL